MNAQFEADFMKVFGEPLTVKVIDICDSVICDTCGEDKSDCPASGGILFQSKAVCPECAVAFEASAKRHNEMHFIRARCPSDMSFAHWVRNVVRK